MKKILVVLGIITAIAVTSAVVWAISPRKTLKPSEYNVGVTYEQAVQDKKPMVTLFYADWCTYCIKFMPKYKILSEVYEGKYNFVMINIDDPNYSKIVKDYSLSGFPTVYIIDPALDNRVLINNGLYDDLRKVRVELERYLRIRSLIPADKIK